MSVNFGDVLSSSGKSFCTFIFDECKERARLSTRELQKHVYSIVREQIVELDRDMYQVIRMNGSLVFRIDHRYFDAQRAFSVVLEALNRTDFRDDSSVSESSPLADLDSFTSLNAPVAQYLRHSVDRNKTLTQEVMTHIMPYLAAEDLVRMIVSNKKALTADFKQGNHFIPLDMSPANWMELLDKKADQWKSVLQRLSARAQRSLSQMEAIAEPRSLVTITSVGSLDNWNDFLRGKGLYGLIMFPERVAYCHSIVTIYTIFEKLHLVYSGAMQQSLDLSRILEANF